jgi:methyl-accepting chemotaxis protein
MSWFLSRWRRARDDDGSVVDAAVDCCAGAAHEVGARLAQIRVDVWEHLGEAIGLMEREVMAAAGSVMDVAHKTRAQIERSKGVLASLEDARHGGIAEVVREQSLMLRTHVDDMQTRVKAQDEQAREALSQVESIGGLARQIAKMASEAQLLALNARIESARLSSESQGFNVVAVEMMRLSNEVAAANQRVALVAERLGAILPTLARGAGELRERVDSFASRAAERIGEVDRKVGELQSEVTEVVRGADLALGEVVQQSQQALSHLQFQDVAAQRLRRIDASLHEAQVATAQAFGDEDSLATVEPPRHEEIGGERLREHDDSNAGEVMLF